MKTRWSLVVLTASLPPLIAAGERFLEDPEISRAVKEVLSAENGINASLDVSTREGIVMLSGRVSSLLEKERASKAAETIKGVRAVIDRTEVETVVRPDAEIKVDVRKALSMDPAVDGLGVAVACSRGRVALTGQVDSRWEKELCGSLSKGVRGVRGVHNQIKVALTLERPDAEIESEIRRRWQLSPWVDERALSMKVEKGEVRLFGVVGSAAERSNAHLFSYVAGVREIDSSAVEVKPRASDPRRTNPLEVKSDERLERDVRDGLRYDPRVAKADVRVEAVGGQVTLSGTVETLVEMKAAESDARNTVGVLRVRNHLVVRPERYPEDSEVERAAADAFSRDPYLTDDDVQIDVRAGALTLRGRVDSRFEKKYAESVAHGVRWIRSVDNRLTFQPAIDVGILSDETLERRVAERIYWNPFLDSSRIVVEVKAGKVIVSGRVDDYHELAQASKVARDAGAKAVDNRLEVASSHSPRAPARSGVNSRDAALDDGWPKSARKSGRRSR